MSKRHQVIIAGGGPTGVALAIELGRRGISCALIERRVGMHNVPKGQNLTARTLDALSLRDRRLDERAH